MNQQTDEQSKTLRNLNLPLKITGIVFWGMVLLAIIVLTFILSDVKERIAEKNQLALQSAVLTISHILSEHRDAPLSSLQKEFADQLLLDTVLGIEIRSDTQPVQVGEYSSACNPHVVELTPQTDSRLQKNFIISICLPDEKQIANDYRKKILTIMAILMLVFGYILQMILKKLLTQPFAAIVTTTNTILDGDTNKRFDDQRQDEFGFIAKFINKALDQQMQKTAELESALRKIQETDDTLHNEREQARVTLNSLSEAVITADNTCNILSMNPSAEQLTGWKLDEALGKTLGEVLMLRDEKSGEQIQLNPADHLRQDKKQCRIKAILDNNKVAKIDVDVSIAAITDEQQQSLGVVAVFQDITHSREMERRLSYQATHDWLTNLYNRQAFENQLVKALETAWMNYDEHALCYIDLDQFKIVNDTCGHVAGDELIKQLAVMLKSKIRNTDILARLGGDEFGLILPGCSLQQATKVINEFHNAIRQFRFYWDERKFEVGMSCGLVPINKDSNSAADIMTAADIACYTAKQQGKNSLYIIEEPGQDIETRKQETSTLVNIKEAITENRFVLYYQPIVPVAQLDHNEALHLEILLRMKNPQGDMVPPGAFLPVAERYKMMVDIDKWVISNLFEFISREMNIADNRYMFNINLSGATMGHPGITEFIKDKLTEYNIPTEMICFEITETVAISDITLALDFIGAMRSLGCHFALDDFGSGMCSFAYLKNLPVDYLKIDGSFVREITHNHMDRELVAVINSIGHMLGMKTIAEFVENRKTFVELKKLNVDYAQGYGIQSPTPLTSNLIEPQLFRQIS